MSLPIDVGSVVVDCNVGPLTVTRRTVPVQNSYGGFDPAASVLFLLAPVAAHVATGRDLEQVPEADRNRETVQFYARDASWPAGQSIGFRVADQGHAPDVITYNGRDYRFTTSQNYSTQGAVWCGLATLVDLQAKP